MPTNKATLADASEIGRAYLAWQAYNSKRRSARIEAFEPERWLAVIKALNGSGGPQRIARQKENGAAPTKRITPRQGRAQRKEKMKAAMAAVIGNQMTLSQAHRKYKVPLSSLHGKVKKAVAATNPR